MQDKEVSKQQAYATFIEGAAERLHALLKRKDIQQDELSGEVERHLISALEIISGTAVEFIDNNNQIGYQFVRSNNLIGAEQPVTATSSQEDLTNYPIWKAVQKNLTDTDTTLDSTGNFSIEQKYRIVMEYLNPKCRSEELCDREGISTETLIQWTLEFLDTGRDTMERAEIPNSSTASNFSTPLAQQVEFEIDRLKEILARLIRENIDFSHRYSKSSEDGKVSEDSRELHSSKQN